MKLSIRTMSSKDIGAVSDMLVDMYNEIQPQYPNIDNEEIERLTFHILGQLKNPLGILLMAFDGKKPIGFFMGNISTHPYGKPEVVGMIQELYIVPEKRGANPSVGMSLINEALKRSIALGAQGLEVMATSSGTDKRWLALGFRPYVMMCHLPLNECEELFSKK